MLYEEIDYHYTDNQAVGQQQAANVSSKGLDSEREMTKCLRRKKEARRKLHEDPVCSGRRIVNVGQEKNLKA